MEFDLHGVRSAQSTAEVFAQTCREWR